MSVTVSKADGVTAFTLTSDPKSPCPALCQILKNLCYCPGCCSVSENLRKALRSSLTLLGALQIMVGLINIGIESVLVHSTWGHWWMMHMIAFPYWLGALFIIFGVMCILSEKYPSPCLTAITVTVNLVGIAFAITAIVFYSISLAGWAPYGYPYDYDDHFWCGTVTRSYEMSELQDKYSEARTVIKTLAAGIDVILIILSTLELCVVISAAIVGIKALKNRQWTKQGH
ncbi:membrane-spanning 4-domains subfamily A member 8-like [Pholidichthys leucotaenia]